jgi:hypothetical protein
MMGQVVAKEDAYAQRRRRMMPIDMNRQSDSGEKYRYGRSMWISVKVESSTLKGQE